MARHEIATKRVVYEIAGADTLTVRRDVPYRQTDAGPLAMDFYYPPGTASGSHLPAVVFVVGYSDAGARARLGCTFKEMESFIDWARLVAMSGAIGVTYTTSPQPAADLDALIDRIRADAASLGVDPDRIAVWACSGHGPTALSRLMHDARTRPACAVFYYPYTLDLEGSSGVADAAKSFKFATPCAGRLAADLALNVPTFLARAGLDQMPYLNTALDRFIAEALARNLPLTVVNYSTGSHAFDLMDSTEESRAIVRQTLAFLRRHLRVQKDAP